MTDRYVTTRFEIEIEIDGITYDDEVVAVSATYGLNSIPTASAVIACGMNTKTNQPSKIHNTLDNLRPRAPAKIILYVINGGGQTKKSPFGGHIIFEGYYAGVGHQRSNTNSNYVLHFVHWLDDLNCGSMANGNWYPGVSNDYAQAALYQDAAASGATGSPIPIFDITNALIGKSSQDLWGKVLKPAFKIIAGWNHPEQQGCKGNDRKNNIDLVGPALAKIPGDAPKPAELPLSIPFITQLNLNRGLSNMLSANHGYNSFWSKLVGELGPSFLFALSPASTFANVIPFFGGLRIEPTVGSAWRVIKLDDYNYSNFNANLAQLIESVNIFYPFQSNAGVSGGQDNKGPTRSFCQVLAQFPEKPTDIRGTVLVRELPHWLHNMTPEYLYSLQALSPTLDTLDPGQGSSTPTGGVTQRPPQTITEQKSVVDRYAQHWYQTTVLGQRFGEFSGKFRLDIAPGSMIAIEVPPAPPPVNPLKGSNEPSYLFASVTQVSFSINAEQHAAGTSFTITNLRNAKENADPTLTDPKPPLYGEGKWPGGPLTVQAAGDNVS